MAEVFLVCEGEPESPDAAVLKTMLRRFGLFVTVHAAGGDAGLGGVRAYLRATRKGSLGLTIEDRNYRPLRETLASWDQGKVRLIWSRHEIENYLLHPRVLARAFERIEDAAEKSEWVRRLPRDEATILERLKAAALPLLDDHAAKLLCHELRTETTRHNPAEFRMTVPAVSPGARAATRADWLPALQNEAKRVREACGRMHDLDNLDPARIEARYDALLAEVHDPVFVNEGRFLSDMGGKELLPAFVAELQRMDAPKLRWNKDDMEAELVEALSDVYEPGLFDPDDFEKLRARLDVLQQRAGLT